MRPSSRIWESMKRFFPSLRGFWSTRAMNSLERMWCLNQIESFSSVTRIGSLLGLASVTSLRWRRQVSQLLSFTASLWLTQRATSRNSPMISKTYYMKVSSNSSEKTSLKLTLTGNKVATKLQRKSNRQKRIKKCSKRTKCLGRLLNSSNRSLWCSSQDFNKRRSKSLRCNRISPTLLKGNRASSCWPRSSSRACQRLSSSSTSRTWKWDTTPSSSCPSWVKRSLRWLSSSRTPSGTCKTCISSTCHPQFLRSKKNKTINEMYNNL